MRLNVVHAPDCAWTHLRLLDLEGIFVLLRGYHYLLVLGVHVVG